MAKLHSAPLRRRPPRAGLPLPPLLLLLLLLPLFSPLGVASPQETGEDGAAPASTISRRPSFSRAEVPERLPLPLKALRRRLLLLLLLLLLLVVLLLSPVRLLAVGFKHRLLLAEGHHYSAGAQLRRCQAVAACSADNGPQRVSVRRRRRIVLGLGAPMFLKLPRVPPRAVRPQGHRRPACAECGRRKRTRCCCSSCGNEENYAILQCILERGSSSSSQRACHCNNNMQIRKYCILGNISYLFISCSIMIDNVIDDNFSHSQRQHRHSVIWLLPRTRKGRRSRCQRARRR